MPHILTRQPISDVRAFQVGFRIMALAVPLALAARFVSVSLPVLVVKCWQDFAPGTIPVLSWGGLRGGISIALALSLPEVAAKGPILAATYAVVVFTIVIQGLSLAAVVRRTSATAPDSSPPLN